VLRRLVGELSPGMTLARPVPAPAKPSTDLFAKGSALSQRDIASLHEAGIAGAWVHEESTAFLETELPEALWQAQRVATVVAHEAMGELQMGRALPAKRCQAAVRLLQSKLQKHPLAHAALEDFTAPGLELAAHSGATAHLALHLGARLEAYIASQRRTASANHAKDLFSLGMGALLHDAGWTRLRDRVRFDADEERSAEEIAAIREHPEAGYELLRGLVEPSAAHVALNHHQRWDGHGFPAQHGGGESKAPAGEEIPVFARIAAAVNHYTRSLQRRGLCGAPQPPVQILFEMRFALFREWFDPTVEAALHELAPPFPIGSVVGLNNGQEAVVVGFAPVSPCQPRVQVLKEGSAPAAIDLAQTNELHITTQGGCDVTPFLY
jgi:HD-GYP domain-containing protein (c-di-GMP phosphodiesterase class II)